MSVLVSAVGCQVEVSASGWSLVQRCPTECGVSVCDHESSTMRMPWPARVYCTTVKRIGAERLFFISTLLRMPDSHSTNHYASSSCHNCHIRLLQTHIFHFKFK